MIIWAERFGTDCILALVDLGRGSLGWFASCASCVRCLGAYLRSYRACCRLIAATKRVHVDRRLHHLLHRGWWCCFSYCVRQNWQNSLGSKTQKLCWGVGLSQFLYNWRYSCRGLSKRQQYRPRDCTAVYSHGKVCFASPSSACRSLWPLNHHQLDVAAYFAYKTSTTGSSIGNSPYFHRWNPTSISHSWLAATIITSVSYSAVPYFDFTEDIAAHIMGQNAAALVELVAVAAGSIVVDYELAGNSPRWQRIGLA